MTSDEPCKLVLTFARTLFINGQATDQTVAAAERLGRTLRLQANVTARWGELQLQSVSEAIPFCQVAADPAGVDMDRVASTMRAIDDVEFGRLRELAIEYIQEAERLEAEKRGRMAESDELISAALDAVPRDYFTRAVLQTASHRKR